MGSTRSSTLYSAQQVWLAVCISGSPELLTLRCIGYDTSWQLPFQIIGRNGVDLNEKWKPHPVSYLSVAVDEFPNMFMALGPNSIIGAGLLIPILEFTVMYAVQATAKLQRERLKSIEVKAQAVQAFDRYIDVSGRLAEE